MASILSLPQCVNCFLNRLIRIIIRGPFHWHGLTSTLISTLKLGWISNFISCFTGHRIIHPWWDHSYTYLNPRGPLTFEMLSNSIHFQLTNRCSCGSVKILETENVSTWGVLNPQSLDSCWMLQPIELLLIRARHLLSLAFEYWLWHG